jgi:hypothetical protein
MKTNTTMNRYLKKLYIKKYRNAEAIIEPLAFQNGYFICETRYKVDKNLIVDEAILMLTHQELVETVPLHCTLELFEEEHPEFFL